MTSYCPDDEPCFNNHCAACRQAAGMTCVTVPELHARLAVNKPIVDRYLVARAVRPSPIVVGKFTPGVVQAVSA